MGLGTEVSVNLNSVYSEKETKLIVIFAFLGALFDGVELNLVSFPLVHISQSLGVTTGNIVEVLTLQGLASLLGGFLFGWLGDTIGRRRSYAICVLVYGLSAFLGGFTHSYGTFLATRIFGGIGIGGQFGLVFTMFTECWKTKRRGFMGGSIQAMFILGEIVTVSVLYFSMNSLGQIDGWRFGFIILGFVSVLIGIASLIYLPESRPWEEYRQKLREGTLPPELQRSAVPFVDLFKGGLGFGTALFMAISTAVFITSYSIGTYKPTFLLKQAHVSLNEQSAIVIIGFVASAIAYLFIGFISDSVSRKWAFFWGGVIGFVGFTIFLFLALTGNTSIGLNYWSSPMFWSLTLCDAGYAGLAVLGIWMSEFYPTRIRSTGCNVCYYVGRGLGAGIYPLFALTIAGSVTMALALGIVGAVAALVLSIFAPDRTGRDIKAIE